MDTDSEWEKWGARDPYFGVITNPEFRRQNMGTEQKEEFFASGRVHAEYILRICRERLNGAFRPRRVLDFGCGVGRVALALGSLADVVVGADISRSMLLEAERNRRERGLENVSFVLSDDYLSTIEGKFDLIHSFIVFQHLEPKRGRALFGKLLDRLVPGGIFAAHFTYAKAQFVESYGRPPPLAASLPETSEDPQRDPIMLMSSYDVNELLFLIQTAGVRDLFVEFTDHGGELGLFLFFQR
jgi:SAM-dependent methyltransferase